MKVITIPCLSDNFAYLIICEQTQTAAVIDVPEASPVLNAINKEKVTLSAILCTHHHADHIDGNDKVCKKYPGIDIVGHASDKGRIPGQTVFLKGDETISIGELKGTWLYTPGHTMGGVTYCFQGAAFSGDALFGGGCGRLFEGTPKDLYGALNEKIGQLSPETKIYFGHEYTINNLRFAKSIEPDNPDLEKRITDEQAKLTSGKFTSPSTLEMEKKTNPFMRCDSQAVIQKAENYCRKSLKNPNEVFGVIRGMKDGF